MNIRTFVSAVLIVGVVAAWSGCADLKNDLPTPTYGLHEKGWIDSSSSNFHGLAVRNAGWDMRDCKRCHGARYDGGVARVSCRTCHTQAAGPEACTTCHGRVNPAPPKSLDGSTAETARGVGAHQAHLLGDDSLSAPVKCSECHNVPQAVYASGHLDVPASARVVFHDTLASFATDNGRYRPAPAYDNSSLRCNNTFCHGAWRLRRSTQPSSYPYQFVFTDSVMAGSNYAPTWTSGAAGDSCGSCHGLPPVGHIAKDRTECYECHSDVVDIAGNIINPARHIDGKIDVYHTVRNF